MSSKVDEKIKGLNSKLDKIEQSVNELIDVSKDCIEGELNDALGFYNKYLNVEKELKAVSLEIFVLDKKVSEHLYDRVETIEYDLTYIYELTSHHINKLIICSTQDLQESNKKSQGLQLAVFSIVLTILAFVLTNAKILATSEIDFKNVLLVNLSYILSADVLFTFIYLFLGPTFYGKKGKLRIFAFIILPILLIFAIVGIALLMK